VAAGLDRRPGHRPVVVVWDGAHDRGLAPQRLLDRDRIGHIEPHGLEAPDPVEVRYLADAKTLISVSEADIRLAVLADLSVLQGEPSQFQIELPAGFEVTGVTGPTLDSTESISGILTLKVNAPAQRSHQFLISMERAISGTKADAPFLAFRGAQRETGEVLVEGAGTMELTTTESGSLKRMDVKEANPYLRSLAHFPPQAAFRYHKQPSEALALALEWVRFPDGSVLAAVAENAVITTLVTSEGKSLTEVKLTVKNQAQPFLKVALPAGATILSADVGGERVKPVQGPDGSRVPLLRPGFRPTGSYTVSFVFMHSGAPFAKKGGAELSLPNMDVPISLLSWEVFLPEQYKVKDFGGNVIATNLVPPAFRTDTVSTVVSPAPASESVEVMAEAPALNGRDDSELSKLKNAPQQIASANVVNLQRRVAGVLPIAIDVPRAGTSFSFVRPLVLDEETKVTFSYKSR